MKASEIIESFNSSTFEVVEDNEYEYISKFVINSHTYLFHAQYMDDDTDTWEISFASVSGEDWFGVTGSGAAAEVLSNVVHSWADFATRHNPTRMFLSAYEPSRKSIYSRIIRKYLSKWQLTVTGDDFVLTRDIL